MSLSKMSLIAILTDWPEFIHHGDYYGGPGGQPFNDEGWWRYRQITGIALECTDNFMLGIQIKYGDYWAPTYAGVHVCPCVNANTFCKPNDNYHVLNVILGSLERVTSVNMTVGRTFGIYFVHSVTLSTNNRVISTCGKQSPTNEGKNVLLEGHRLEFISGRGACVLDGLQFHWSNP